MSEIKFTKRAVSKLKEFLKNPDGDDFALKISVVRGGCSGFGYEMRLIDPAEYDDENSETFTVYGVKIIVDLASLQYLRGAEVDFEETLDGQGFKFNNPNAKIACGCGRSFLPE